MINSLNDDIKTFLVMGPSKSGTTWLQRLLDSHPKIRCHFQLPIFPALKLMPHYFPAENSWRYLFEPAKVVYNERISPYNGIFDTANEEQEYIIRYHYFSRLYRNMLISRNEISKNSKLKNQTHIDRIHLEVNKALCENFLQDQSDKILYGSKSYTNLELFFKAYPNAKVVGIFRDGRDVAVSKRFHLYRMGSYFLGDEKFRVLNIIHQTKFGRRISNYVSRKTNLINRSSFKEFSDGRRLFSDEALKKILGDWKNIVEYLLSWEKEKHDHLYLIRYEDLKSRPENTIASVYNFLDVPMSTDQIRDIVRKNEFQKNKTGEQSFYRKGVTGDWKNYFTDRDLEIAKSIAGDVLVKLGYEKDNSWKNDC